MPSERISKSQRWLDLIAFLLGHRRPVTVEQIFSAVPAYREAADPGGDPLPASVRRMFERDKDELRSLGIPIESERFAINYGTEFVDGYVLRPDAFYLPYLELVDAAGDGSPGTRAGDAQGFTAPETDLLMGALQEAAELPDSPFAAATRSAVRKLSFDLGPVNPSGLVRVEAPGAPELAAVVGRLSEALLGRKRVEFRYHGIQRGEPTDRCVLPYGLLMERGAWYLVGHDELRDGIRVFHAGRIEPPRAISRAPSTPDYEIPADFDLGDYRDLAAWNLGGENETPVTAFVYFRWPHDQWAERNGYGELAEPGEPGSSDPKDGSVRRFTLHHVDPFCDWILGLRGAAEIIAPEDLRTEVRRRAHEIARAHG